jgi:hypothetical protein
MTKPTPAKRISRLHSKNPADAAWRAQQAQVDADIEGLPRDPEIDQFVSDMTASGVPVREQIERLKTYIRRRAAASRKR